MPEDAAPPQPQPEPAVPAGEEAAPSLERKEELLPVEEKISLPSKFKLSASLAHNSGYGCGDNTRAVNAPSISSFCIHGYLEFKDQRRFRKPISTKIGCGDKSLSKTELDESQSQLMGRLRGLKEDLLNWRSSLDTQVTKYKSELSDIKTALNSEIEQLRSDFQELRTTLKKQQEDVSNSLKNLGLQDATDNDGNKGSGEENASEGVSDTLGNLKLDDTPKNHDESSDANDEKNETIAEDGTVDKTVKAESASDE
ncbi:hypothetical protein OsJ_36391 [Oryza sativa Japonica Group]|uniref:Uncharacterized protein n=1 Tax=Oryza sativa subsp. japonica TaxID=39947 RepID=A3CI54_ORYSJ|nr:hypothetical protein OsJ_36391 [Oryza sativa Japonica Group]